MSDPTDKKAFEAELKDPATRPLNGRTIMVTRPRGQASEITRLLEELGAEVIHCPTIEFIEPSDWSPLDAALDRIESYDWIVFTSSNGARFFLRRLIEQAVGGVSLLAAPVLCAMGHATAATLKDAGIRVDVIARDSKAEGAFSAIVEHVGGEDKIRGLRFLIPRARVARDYLPDELKRLGAQVEAVEVYQTVKPDADGRAIARLFEEGRIDAITFTSSSTVSNFAAIVESKDLSGLLRNTLVACIGPVTAATAAEYGIRKVVQPDVYTAAALVETIARSISSDVNSSD
ncbi:MAG: uroporphyrinogen-III synthase [Blastocatellia bacterium]|nr:uroporphyrinogen-III synthase [Blastocatellia bacterium]